MQKTFVARVWNCVCIGIDFYYCNFVIYLFYINIINARSSSIFFPTFHLYRSANSREITGTGAKVYSLCNIQVISRPIVDLTWVILKHPGSFIKSYFTNFVTIAGSVEQANCFIPFSCCNNATRKLHLNAFHSHASQRPGKLGVRSIRRGFETSGRKIHGAWKIRSSGV